MRVDVWVKTMLMRRTSRRGLGTTYKTDPSTGTVIDCDSWNNLFQSVCWNPFSPQVVPVSPGSASGGSSGGGDDGLVPSVAAVPAASTACSQTIISGVCDWIVYAAGMAALLGLVFMG